MSSESARRVAKYVPWIVLGASMLLFWAGTLQAFGFAPARMYGDAWNYLGAGERLNAGHPLYALSLGDRPIDIVVPYWPVSLDVAATDRGRLAPPGAVRRCLDGRLGCGVPRRRPSPP